MNNKTKILSVVIIIILAVVAVIVALNSTDGSKTGTSATKGVVISEVMSANRGICTDNLGNYSDWLELYNGTGEDIDLSNLALSDDENTPIKWAFQSGTLKAGGYIVVYMSGSSKNTNPAQGSYHANFKLSASKETIVLSNVDGDILDKYEWENMGKNVSHGRVGNEWQVFTEPTPGFPNTEEGIKQYKESRAISDPAILITEVMGSNKTTVKDNAGLYSDYVEVLNVSDKSVNLLGMALSDDETDPMQWRFPDVSLKPGEYLIVWCSGDTDLTESNPKKGLHSNFRVSTYKETILLSTADGKLLDKVYIAELKSDASYAREFNGDKATSTFSQTFKPTPGYPNTDKGYSDFLAKNKVSLGDIYISEVLASNSIKDLEGDKQYYDFVEIHNKGSNAINLKDYAITNNTKNPAKWRFPDITIAPGAYEIVLASGLSEKSAMNKKYMHTNFKISNEGDIIALYDPDGNLLDKCTLGYIPANISYGRSDADESGFYFFTEITPKAKNGQGAKGFLDMPSFSAEGGIYSGAQTVEIKAAEGAIIYYTLDRSTPTTSSPVYSAPIKVDKTTIIRAIAVKSGYLNSYCATSSYLIGVNHTLPVISVVTDDKNLWGDTGIYDWGPNVTEEYKNDDNNIPFKRANFHQEWERPGSIEIIKDNKSVFSQNIDMRIFGDYSRMLPQKSMAFFARSEYGTSRINYSLIDKVDSSDYKSFVLRNGGNDGNLAKMRDITLTSLAQETTDLDVASYQSYVCYLNGQYWGVYHMREKVNKHMLAQKHNLPDADNIDLLVGTGTALVGDNTAYKSMIEFMKNNSLADQNNFDYIASLMDVHNFMDYIICEIWSSNSDTGNIKYWRDKSGATDGKWRWILFDLDWGLWPTYVDSDRVARQLDPAGHGVGSMYPTTIFRSLMKNEKWKNEFIERFAYHLKNTYSAKKVNERIDEIYNSIKSEMPAERDKFGGTIENWNKHVGNLRTFANNRGKYVVEHLKKNLTLTDAQKQMLDNAIK